MIGWPGPIDSPSAFLGGYLGTTGENGEGTEPPSFRESMNSCDNNELCVSNSTEGIVSTPLSKSVSLALEAGSDGCGGVDGSDNKGSKTRGTRFKI